MRKPRRALCALSGKTVKNHNRKIKIECKVLSRKPSINQKGAHGKGGKRTNGQKDKREREKKR
jgi:hypothetical protein